jgi:hypothetical protein
LSHANDEGYIALQSTPELLTASPDAILRKTHI